MFPGRRTLALIFVIGLFAAPQILAEGLSVVAPGLSCLEGFRAIRGSSVPFSWAEDSDTSWSDRFPEAFKTLSLQEDSRELLRRLTLKELKDYCLTGKLPARIVREFDDGSGIYHSAPLVSYVHYHLLPTIHDFEKEALDQAKRLFSNISALMEDGAASEGRFLEEQAALAGTHVEVRSTVFRVDNRSPEEVRSQNGFHPNPDKPIGGIFDHSRIESQGTRNFVSTTFDESPMGLLTADIIPLKTISSAYSREDQQIIQDLFREKMQFVEKNLHTGRLGFFLVRSASSNPESFVEDMRVTREFYSGYDPFESGVRDIRVMHEYQLENVSGVSVPESVGVASEKEFLTTHVPSNQLSRWRPIYVLPLKSPSVGMVEERVVIFGDWRPVDP